MAGKTVILFQLPTVLFSLLVAFWSVLVSWVLLTRPRAYVSIDFSCSNYYESNIGISHLHPIQGIPFTCGWHELRPGSDVKVYTFLQPRGSLCQSNAGYVRGNQTGAGLLIDTLVDPVLTKGMLDRLPGYALSKTYPVTAAIYTHPDIDHIFGDQILSPKVPRFGHTSVNEELRKFPSQRRAISVTIAIGHYMWSFAECIGWRGIVRSLPEGLRESALRVVGWAYMHAALAKFSFHALHEDKFIGVTQSMPDAFDLDLALGNIPGPIQFQHIGALHSKSDSVVLLPAARVCFAGDLLFVGVAPVMWAGTAAAWAAALDALLARTGDGWIFVGGHGPPTDATGVRRLRAYLAHLDAEVTSLCPAEPTVDGTTVGGGAGGHDAEDAACAKEIFRRLPPALRADFDEPERILISAQVRTVARGLTQTARLLHDYDLIPAEYYRFRLQLPGPLTGLPWYT
jgi:glyoxylase-like metal-dependent hydrolase (beta-lactamase superfamily II)